jgi:hypothetical protein
MAATKLSNIELLQKLNIACEISIEKNRVLESENSGIKDDNTLLCNKLFETFEILQNKTKEYSKLLDSIEKREEKERIQREKYLEYAFSNPTPKTLKISENLSDQVIKTAKEFDITKAQIEADIQARTQELITLV